MAKSGVNGQQRGAEFVEALTRYLDALGNEGRALPAKNGKVCFPAVALASGVSLQSLYKNSHCKEMLEKAAQTLGLRGIDSREVGTPTQDDTKTQRIQVLELQVASLQAEVEGLRRKLRNFAHIEEHLTETGRRVIP